MASPSPDGGLQAPEGGLRAQCEFMAWATRGPFPETGLYLDGCFRVLADRNKLHQAVKPLVLMERLVTVAPAGGLVVDQFAGSGTTVARLRQGRRVIGVEISRTGRSSRGSGCGRM